MRALCASVLVLLALAATAAPATAAVPRDFFGVMADGPLLDPRIDLGRESALIAATGTRTLRVAFYWRDLEPERGRLDLSSTDRIVTTAAGAGLRVMPVLVRAPAWASGSENPAAPPRDTADYARFVGAVAARYGRGGTLWREQPALPARPIHGYQIWNEPNIRFYWRGTPWPRTYLALLRAARRELKGRDRRAQVVLAGLPNRSWEDLARIYRAGGRGAFDVAAVHPFSGLVGNVVRIIRANRAVMRRFGDARTPIVASEVTWTSSRGLTTFDFPFERTETGQAQRVRQALTTLARRRRSLRLQQVFWYTWLSPLPGQNSWINHAGLRRLDRQGRVVAKPAYRSYRATVRRLTRAGSR